MDLVVLFIIVHLERGDKESLHCDHKQVHLTPIPPPPDGLNKAVKIAIIRHNPKLKQFLFSMELALVIAEIFSGRFFGPCSSKTSTYLRR